MRTTERLTKLKAWIENELCKGREMKAPAENNNIAEIVRQEPRCFLAWQPTRPDVTGNLRIDPLNVCPGIVVMPKASYAKHVEEKRFDRYNKVFRPQEMGNMLCVDILFSIYEPGIRLPGFVDSAKSGKGLDLTLLQEGTEQGLFTLCNWMDDCKEALLTQKQIPGTDLIVDEESVGYSLYSDQSYVVDKRPLYYGFITVNFYGHADEGINSGIRRCLD